MTNESQKIASDGYMILLVSLVLALAGFWWHWYLGLVFFVWFGFCVYFFRNPTRVCSQDPHLLISPADGKVIYIGRTEEPHMLKKEMTRITVFMSPFDVHVNRAPESGVVKNVFYQKGKYLAAFDERASLENERSAIHMQTVDGLDVVFVQIAGWFARRIVSYPKIGDALKRGSIFGLIKFSSRMDVYFPDELVAAVKVGDVVRAGQTIIAKAGKNL